MNFFAAFVLFFSCILCASAGGWGMAGICALLCLLLSFWAGFLPKTPPRFLRPLAGVSLLLRLLPLWGVGEWSPPVFFALILVVTALIALDRGRKRGLLATACVPFSLLYLLCALFCFAGTPCLPDAFVQNAPVGLLSAVFCPLSSALALPSVAGKRLFLPLAVLASALVAAPALFFSFPLWREILLLISSPVAAACELRILCGKPA